MWTDLTSSMIIKSDIDRTNAYCNKTSVASIRQKIRMFQSLTESQSACVTFWALTYDLNCPVDADREYAALERYQEAQGEEGD